jgi:signal transduction histidine kinase
VALQIDDDGAGFEKRDVSSLRLGIDVSIRGRFATLTGGSATVRSQRGRGTTVSLEWVQP